MEKDKIIIQDLEGDAKIEGIVRKEFSKRCFTMDLFKIVDNSKTKITELYCRIQDGKENTFDAAIEMARKIIIHSILYYNVGLEGFNINQKQFIDLIKYKGADYRKKNGEIIITSESDAGDLHNLIIGKDTIREELYLSNGGSMGSIIYEHGRLLDEEPDTEYLDEETRKEYERVNQSINGMNDIFEIMSEKCTDYRVNKKELWRETKEEYNLDPGGSFYYSYGDMKIINQETGEEIEVDEETQDRFFDNLVEQGTNEKMVKMFHNLLTKKERKVVELAKDIESRYDKIVDDIDTDTGEIIFKE